MWDDILFRLRAVRVAVSFEAAGAGAAPSFAGAAWRGAMGAALRGAACTTGAPTCDGCPIAADCDYGYVFETPVPEGARRLRMYPHAPHPFVLRVLSPTDEEGCAPEVYEEGQRTDLEIVLFGRGAESLPAMVDALARAGERGIGPDRVPMRLLSARGTSSSGRGLSVEAGLVAEETGFWVAPGAPSLAALPEAAPLAELIAREALALRGPADVTLNFHSPARVVHAGALAKSLPLHVVVRSLLRRVSAIAHFHAGVDADVDFAGLIRRATQVETVHEALSWRDQWRRSARQEAAHALGGLVGQARYARVPRELVLLFVQLEVHRVHDIQNLS